jgi:glycosyltransferase involved in cell wall biosynthesis
MLISVIMSVRDNQSTISHAIDSILEQTHEDFEFLILDDFSNDDSYKVVKEYEKKDDRLKVFKNKENIGLTKSLNILISMAKGTLIARQDADDISNKQRFSKQVNYFQKSKYDFCVTRAESMQKIKVIPKYSFYLPARLVSSFKNPFIHGTLMIRREVLLEIGSYDERFYYAQDFRLFKDLLTKNKKFKYIKEPLYCLNMKNNISSLKKIEQKYYSDLVRKNKIPLNLIK